MGLEKVIFIIIAICCIIQVTLSASGESQQTAHRPAQASEVAGMVVRHRFMASRPMTKKKFRQMKNSNKNVHRPDFRYNGPTKPMPTYAKANVRGTIIGGSLAVLGQYPWQCAIIMDSTWLCGGSVIHYNYILTAGHCCQNIKSFSVTCGGINRNTTEASEEFRISTQAIKHPWYNDQWLYNDLCLVVLPTPLPFHDTIQPIRLPSYSDGSQSFANIPVFASGYGKTAAGTTSKVLYHTRLTTITNAQCAQTYGSTAILSTTLCTAANGINAICGGDSGGPLVRLEPDLYYTQIGIVSFASSRGCLAGPEGFCRVASYTGWISSITGLEIRP